MNFRDRVRAYMYYVARYAHYDTLCYDTLCYDTLCYDTLCYDTLCCDTLCYDTLSYDTLCYDTLCCDTLCYDTLCCDTLCYDTQCYDTLCYKTLWHRPSHPFNHRLLVAESTLYPSHMKESRHVRTRHATYECHTSHMDESCRVRMISESTFVSANTLSQRNVFSNSV